MFTLLELLLGGRVESAVMPQRKITDVEKSLVQMLLRVVLQDLAEAWKGVADMSFYVQSLASEPQLLHVLAPAEAVVVITIEVKVDRKSGLMNLAIPCVFIKRLRTKFELLQQVRKAESKSKDQLHIARLLQRANVTFEARIDESISGRDLLNLKAGDVLVLDHPEHESVLGSLNGRDLWLGNMAAAGEKLAFQVTGHCQADQ
jgi:flagellar motor switch protein FliM